VVFRALGDWRAEERVKWEERELVLLLNQKRGGEGACTGGCYGGEVADGRAVGRRGTRERAREDELGRCSGWGRCVEARAAGGGAGEELAWR
jgi:hypothetical protein